LQAQVDAKSPSGGFCIIPALLEQRDKAVAVLDIGRRDGHTEHQAQRVDMAWRFLPLIFFPAPCSAPFFGAFHALKMAAVGVASLPASSRASWYSAKCNRSRTPSQCQRISQPCSVLRLRATDTRAQDIEHTVENLSHPFGCRAALAFFGYNIGPNNVPFLVRHIAWVSQALPFVLLTVLRCHPDRNAQFDINAKVKAALAACQPAISVDTKKKELVGDFKNGRRELCRKGEPEPVRVHDFGSNHANIRNPPD
jgi:hypothetical protein